jgi:natural product precursor
MKKLGLLKLNQISRAEMDEREMNVLLGGDCTSCACGCYVADTYTNANANNSYGYTYSAGFTGGLDGNDACGCSGSTNAEAQACKSSTLTTMINGGGHPIKP